MPLWKCPLLLQGDTEGAAFVLQMQRQSPSHFSWRRWHGCFAVPSPPGRCWNKGRGFSLKEGVLPLCVPTTPLSGTHGVSSRGANCGVVTSLPQGPGGGCYGSAPEWRWLQIIAIYSRNFKVLTDQVNRYLLGNLSNGLIHISSNLYPSICMQQSPY